MYDIYILMEQVLITDPFLCMKTCNNSVGTDNILDLR